MQPVPKDIDVYRGDTFEFFFRIRHRVYDATAQTYVAGDYVDLTGWTGLAQIRENADAAAVLASFTVTIANQAALETRGGVLLTLPPAVSAGLPALGLPPVPAGIWDVQLTNATAEVRTYYKGAVTVDKDVSRA